jgi:hypothetical protein
MEYIETLYFFQLFIFIPIMLTTIVSQYLNIQINDLTLEQIILFGYLIILYCNKPNINYLN